MDILKLRHRLLRLILVPLGAFVVSYAALILFFSQQSGHILWENLVASAIFAAVLAFFTLLCLFSKWVLLMWLLGTISLLVIYTAALLDWDSFTLGYLYDTCLVSFYCLNQAMPTWLALVINTSFKIIFLIDVMAGAILLLKTLWTLNSLYPQTKYFLGTFITGLFAVGFGFIQKIPDIPTYTSFQYLLLGLFGLFAVASLCFGFFYKNLGTRVERFKRIYGAAVTALVFLLPLLVPFDVNSAEDKTAAFFGQIGFGMVALFSFVYLGFFAKARSATQTLNGTAPIARSKNKRARH